MACRLCVIDVAVLSWPIWSVAVMVVSPGGALGQVSYGGVQLRGPNPYPILGKAGLRKHTLF